MPSKNGEVKRVRCSTGFRPSKLSPLFCETCSQSRGAHKRPDQVRALIVITESETHPGKFKASLNFEPSIQDKKKKGEVAQWARENIVCRTAWHVWNQLKSIQKGTIILTDER